MIEGVKSEQKIIWIWNKWIEDKAEQNMQSFLRDHELCDGFYLKKLIKDPEDATKMG